MLKINHLKNNSYIASTANQIQAGSGATYIEGPY